MAIEGEGATPQPFTTPTARVGVEGLQINKPLDLLSPQELSRTLNLYATPGGDLTSRPGQLLKATGPAGTVHSIRRLNDPKAGTATRFWGIGTSWFRGFSGGVTALEAGFSGNPLTHCTTRPPFSGESWMFAADASKMRKASATSPSLPIGLPIPTSLATAIGSILTTNLISFDAGDGSAAASWTAYGSAVVAPIGTPHSAGTQGVSAQPVLTDVPGLTSGNGVRVTTAPGTATSGYLSTIAITRAVNAAILQANPAFLASDQDIIHLDLWMDHPEWVDEVRLYFVVSPLTIAPPGAIPGTSPSQNVAAYVRAYRPSDYAAFVGLTADASTTATAVLRSSVVTPPLGSHQPAQPIATSGTAAPVGTPGAGTWVETGKIGVPVRRGDFLKIGTAGQPGTNWSTVTGVYIVIVTNTNQVVQVAFDDCYLTGGNGPDSSEPGASPYDYRVVNYDPRTGARSNGSVTQATPLFLDALRQQINISPHLYGDPAVRQEAYRRGGSLVENWYFVGVNTTDGGLIVDTFTDAFISNADTLPTDHFQPVATVDATGATVLNQPVPVIFGPLDDGTLLALGDPYRPGHLYASNPGEPDHWPSSGAFAVEVCSPAEELMNGCVWGGQAFVLSRQRGYAVHTNLTGAPGIIATPTICTPGLAARWGFAVGPGGIYYVARDGIRVTAGGESHLVADQLRPLFNGQSVNGYLPIDFSVPAAIRLEVHNNDLWFLYQDTGAVRQCLVFSLLQPRWYAHRYAHPAASVYSDETRDQNTTAGANQLLLGSTNGSAYTWEGFTDDGTPIPFSCRTGAYDFGKPREEKLLGDLALEADLQGITLTLQTYLNMEATQNIAQTVVGAVGRRAYNFTPFGTTPQHARTCSVDLSGTAPTGAAVTLAYLGVGYLSQPEITMNRVTAWGPATPGGTEGYLWACTLDCDTGGSPRTILVEVDLAGVITTAATLTVNANGRHKLWFSWPAVHAQAVRLRPTGACEPWILFAAGWLATPEPPRIAGIDSGFEGLGDTYYTGLDLEIDTFGVAKSFQLSVDGVLIATQNVQTPGRRWVHLTVTPGRGHVYRFVATDANPGLLYTHKWLVEGEPGEQTNWNQNYTVWSSLSDKYLKGLVIEADTFGLDKTVTVDVDGTPALVTVAGVNHAGRQVKNYTFPQVLGRVFRVIPTDANPGRLYTLLPLFDEEPYMLARWETQLLDFDLPQSGWGSILSADVCYKAAPNTTLTIQCYNSLGVLVQTLTEALPSTAGTKRKRFAPVHPNKGVLFKFVFTTDDATPGFTLYQEESRLRVKPWASDTTLIKTFGNDDLDRTRNMRSATVSASRSGGGS